MSQALITCLINGEEYFCQENHTILQVAQEHGINIPVLCYHPQLSTMGSCRICVVEIEGEKLLSPACSTFVREGMRIKTDSERVLYARRLILEMILSQHHGDCLTCDASGDCLLEKYAYEYHATGMMFEKSNYNEYTHGVMENNPLMILDRGKCILCGRCIRACDEWSHRNAISFVHKGNKMVVSTIYDKGLEENKECIFCGNCISVCPVGAFSEKSAVRKGRPPEIKKTRTICPYCGVGCGIVVYSKNNTIIKIRGDHESPVSKGRLCIKGKFGFDFVNSPERLTQPLIKDEEGNFKPVSFIDALLHIKNKIEEIQHKNGTFAGLCSAKCTNEDNYVFQKFFRSILHTNNIDHCARICHSSTVSGLKMTLGSGAMTNAIEDIESVDCFLIIGSNMTSSHPIISWDIISRIRKGAILILIDPRRTPLSKYATIHLQIIPGSDIALIQAFIKIIYEESLYDHELKDKEGSGFEEFISKMEEIPLDYLIKETGCKEEDVRLAARLYAISGASSIFYAMGITQHVFGTYNVISLANLALFCGKIGSGPMGINPLRGQNNVQGACDMGGLPDMFPGYASVEDAEAVSRFSEKWISDLVPVAGKTLVEIITGAEKGDIDFLYIMGENPMISDPDSDSVARALENVPFLVVQDIFLTETAQYADVVLPSASFAEKDGTFTNTERRVQRVQKIVDSPGDALEDWLIIQKLAELFGIEWKYETWVDIFKEIREMVPSYSHINPNLLFSKDNFWPGDEKGNSVKRLYQKGFPPGKGKLHFVEPVSAYSTNKKYPFLLITGRIYEHFHTKTMTGKSEGINQLQPGPFLIINPKDALKLKITDNEEVTVVSEVGEINVRVQISIEVKKETCFLSFHFKESQANRLTSKKELDPLSKIAALKVTPVSIIPAGNKNKQ